MTPHDMKTQKVRIHWKAPTGQTGHGELLERGLAEAWLEKAKNEHPELEHWLQS